MAAARILIVENEIIIAKNIEIYLKQAGYVPLKIALSGDEAIARSCEQHPNLILMDIVMEPELDGIQTAARIHEFLDVPIIYITAHADDDHLKRARQTEPYGYLIKPIEMSVLHSTIEVALHKHAVQKKLKQQLRHLTAIRNMDHAILSQQDQSAVLAIFLQQIISSLNVDAARILLFDPTTQRLQHKASLGIQKDAPETTNTNQQNIFIPSLNHQAEYPHLTWLKEHGFTSYVSVPLLRNETLNGTLELFQHTEIEPDDEWRSMLDALIGQMEIGLEHFALLQKLHNAHEELIQSYDATIQGWARALELRDQETQGHCTRVTTLAMKLAAAMRYPEEKLLHLRRGALLHDIGKMGIPDGSLLKPGPLTPEDWVVMRKHPQYAYDMLNGIPFLQDALDIPWCHHEKWDGSGYPRGLKGTEIPLAARIFAVVDVWDALRSERIYRESWAPEKVLAYIADQTGTHFDPQVVDVFLKMYETENF